MVRMRLLPAAVVILLAGLALCSGASLENGDLTVKASSCPSGWHYASTVNLCYIIPNVFLPLEDAKSYCTNVTGGELVTVFSQAEYDEINSYIQLQSFSHLYPLWIGLEGDRYWPYYQWQDGRYANFTKWINGTAPDTKGGECFVWKSTVANSGWTTLDCKYQQPFICKQHSPNCSTIIVNGTTGNITSPNYPDMYDIDTECYYHLNVPEGNVVHLTFDLVDIDSYSDVYVYDGPTADNRSSLLGYAAQSYWDYYGDDEFESTGSSMSLKFKTTAYTYYPWYYGWVATFTAVPAPVPTLINGTSGSLTSPNYPGNYTVGDDLFYQINAPPNYHIVLTIWDFVSETSYDWLRIRESSSLLLTWTGNHTADVPKSVTSKTNVVSLLWHTDLSVVRTGFNLTWVAQPSWG
uniref:C-type lectin domain-containing protein n=1 Tax=Panagrellus redivivus TaxID=6233 RepID=A0A7E4VUN1_PANRE